MRKLKSRRGYTLTEALAAVLVLALLAVGISAGLSAAVRVHRTSLFHSEAGTLCDTLNTAAADLLRSSSDRHEESGVLRFSVPERGILDGCLAVKDGRVVVFAGPSDTEGYPLAAEGAYCGMSVNEFILTADGPVLAIAYTVASGELTLGGGCTCRALKP